MRLSLKSIERYDSSRLVEGRAACASVDLVAVAFR